MTHAPDPQPAHSPLALVTGASSGIGWAVAQRLAGRGYRLAVVARRGDRLAELAAACGGEARCRAIVADLAEPGVVEGVIAPVVGGLGPVAVLVNNAGAGLNQPFLEHDEAVHQRVWRVNYFAAAQLMRLVLPGMLGRGAGSVINVASISAKVGPWGHGAYAASKAALVSLTQSLWAEHQGSGVHFCYVNPGIVATAFFDGPGLGPLWQKMRGRAVSAERVAAGVCGLLDRPRLELCVPRHYRALDWLRAVHPGLAMRVVARGSRPGP